jgi:ankyrin repeat protein
MTIFVAVTVGLFVATAARVTNAQHETAQTENYLNAKRAASCFADENVAALAVAAARGDLQRIDYLVAQGVNPNAQANNSMTPLMWAIQAKNKAGFRRLLQRGGCPDYVVKGDVFDRFLGPASRSLIGLASKDENDSEWLEILLNHGANPNLVHPKIGGDDTVDYSAGTTPIFNAIDSRRMRNVDLLVRSGADINHQDNRGNTPMVYAASFGGFNIVLRLLEAGADYRIRNNDGDSLAYVTARFERRIDDVSNSGRDCKRVIVFLGSKGVDMDLARSKVAEERRRSEPKYKH